MTRPFPIQPDTLPAAPDVPASGPAPDSAPDYGPPVPFGRPFAPGDIAGASLPPSAEIMQPDEVMAELSQVARAQTNDPYVRPTDKVRALELVGKYHGQFDRGAPTGTLADMSVAELMQRIAAIDARMAAIRADRQADLQAIPHQGGQA